MSRQLDYCAVSSVLGRKLADQLWDRLTPRGIDLDFLPDQDAMTVRMMEREKQDMKCAVCKRWSQCRDD